MASMTLPKSLNYAETLPYLPECNSWTQTVNPVNGSTFDPTSVIQFDLPSRGFINPTSIYLRFKMNLKNTTASAIVPTMRGTPVFTPFVRLETIIGSQVVESINQYNQVANLLSNITLSVSEKYGLQTAYGYIGTTPTPAMALMDGKTFPSLAATTGSDDSYYSAPLVGSLLTHSQKLLPVFCMPSVRIQLTLDTLANMFDVAPSSLTLSNVELSFSVIDFGPSIEQMVAQMGPKLYIKSQSFANSATRIESGSSGTMSLVYNQRLASIKSAYVLFTGTSSNSLNKWADAYDPTQSSGEISISVGGTQYPQRPLSFANNKAGILMELRNAINSIYERQNSVSINTIEFAISGNSATTVSEPAKCYVGINLEKISIPNGALLTGISSQNSPITVTLSSPTATAQAHNVNLILNYDAIMEVDVMNKQVSIKQ